MGSLSFGGVLFSVYSDDHPPAHVHGEYGEVRVILELVAGGGVVLSDRKDAVRPRNGKRSDVRRTIRSATINEATLRELWRKTHGD